MASDPKVLRLAREYKENPNPDKLLELTMAATKALMDITRGRPVGLAECLAQVFAHDDPEKAKKIKAAAKRKIDKIDKAATHEQAEEIMNQHGGDILEAICDLLC